MDSRFEVYLCEGSLSFFDCFSYKFYMSSPKYSCRCMRPNMKIMDICLNIIFCANFEYIIAQLLEIDIVWNSLKENHNRH